MREFWIIFAPIFFLSCIGLALALALFWSITRKK